MISKSPPPGIGITIWGISEKPLPQLCNYIHININTESNAHSNIYIRKFNEMNIEHKFETAGNVNLYSKKEEIMFKYLRDKNEKGSKIRALCK